MDICLIQIYASSASVLWLTDWLIDWLTDWLNEWMNDVPVLSLYVSVELEPETLSKVDCKSG